MKKDVGERKESNATLLHKSEVPYEDLATGRGIPIQKPIFELTYRCDTEEELKFAVSEYEYAVVNEGDYGLLVYAIHKHYLELLSFSDKIKEFKM